ncbi:AAA family ATPase [Ichthyobacterium seriolicida]|uniref:Protein CR006 P-loop domain-containing protein n=1 Tax=Ichthyobacterium seriolicida TaxID=242600 RepID=A0A1J1E4L1_9FLAO|nr:AAA family ATPase [Ichthyobacterium seriolicida]BAV94988.1 hypothetical protein JBKA6_0975 [Ichthyobacterium seriolicida]
MGKIVTKINCKNVAPLSELSGTINSGSMKIGVFANNGSGKTFLSRLFRLTEQIKTAELGEDDHSQTDKIISIGSNSSQFSFSITNNKGETVEDFSIELKRGEKPEISNTNYLYHTFNQDYVEQNISSKDFDKDGQIDGFILGEANINLHDEEEKLNAIEKESNAIADELRNSISSYISEKIAPIKDITRLTEYRILNYDTILKEFNSDSHKVEKSFDEYKIDYDKIKSVPDTLENIDMVDEMKIDVDLIKTIVQKNSEEFSLSTLAEDFKLKLKGKQGFIEGGMKLLNDPDSNKRCPFCEQDLESEALKLIDDYTTYLNDSEAKTIKMFSQYNEQLTEYINTLTNIENENNKRILKFNNYKEKYIPSMEEVSLESFKNSSLLDLMGVLIENNKKKISGINKPVIVENEYLTKLKEELLKLNGVIKDNNEKITTINKKKDEIGKESKDTRKNMCKSAFRELASTHKESLENVLKLKNDWTKLNSEITKNKEKQKISKRTQVADTIRTVLKCFFADKYQLDENTFRLIFNKNLLEKNQAKDVLSEGEKNIVAFAYYMGDSHLKISKEDEYKNLFLIIDDPISSMDFYHVYKLCEVIRNVKKFLDKINHERFIIFTHNNDFMRILITSKIIDKKLLLRNNKLKDFNSSLTVPYIHHLMDVYSIASKKSLPTHTTGNSIRHIIETLTRFDKVDISDESIANYINDNLPKDKKSYTLINDLSHGGWRTEQAPITEEDYVEVCKTITEHINSQFPGQIEYCKKKIEEN